MRLEEIRTEIDNIDHEMVNLFKMRMNLVGEVANYKMANSLPIFNPERENEILSKLTPEGEMGPFTKDFLTALFEISKNYQRLIMAQGE